MSGKSTRERKQERKRDLCCGKVTKISESCWCLRVFPLRRVFLLLCIFFFHAPSWALGRAVWWCRLFATPPRRPHHHISPHLILQNRLLMFLLPLLSLSLCYVMCDAFTNFPYESRSGGGKIAGGMRCVFYMSRRLWAEWGGARQRCEARRISCGSEREREREKKIREKYGFVVGVEQHIIMN